MSGNLAIGVLHEERMESSFVRCLTAITAGGVPVIYNMGPASRLDYGRNGIFDRFLQGDEEWLLMIDTDMVFTPWDVAQLIQKADATSNPITGGLYIQGHTEKPVAWKMKDGIHRFWDGKGKGLVSVDAIGFGFTAIHRSVLAAMELSDQPPCDNRRTGPKGQALGDDLSFCYFARGLGFSIKLNTEVRLGHTKSITWYPK